MGRTRGARWGRRLLGAATLLLGLSLLGMKLRYGGGEPYPDAGTAPLVPDGALEVLVETPFPPGNVACSPDGRIFYDLHPFAAPERFLDATLFELVEGEPVPFPDLAAQPDLAGVLGLTVDRQNRLWTTLPAGIEERPTRVQAFDLATGERVVDVTFPEGAGPFAQDLRVAPDGATVYLADTGIFRFTPPALVVLDVASGRARRVLEGHPSLSPQDWVIRTSSGPLKLLFGLLTWSVGVDGLALDADGEWLAYAAMSHDTAYRVPTRALRDESLSAAEVAEQIERLGRKPLSDGIELDAAGNLYLTDVEHGGLDRLTPDGTLETLVRDPRVLWSDGLCLTPDGALLLTDSRIPAYVTQLLGKPARETVDRAGPHAIYRVKLSKLP